MRLNKPNRWVSIPGASMITVRFDTQTKTEPEFDFLKLYKNASHNEVRESLACVCTCVYVDAYTGVPVRPYPSPPPLHPSPSPSYQPPQTNPLQTWGQDKYHGGRSGSAANWPGLQQPALEIPADSFCVYFHSDGCVYWLASLDVMGAFGGMLES
jgi:hypothetical protein